MTARWHNAFHQTITPQVHLPGDHRASATCRDTDYCWNCNRDAVAEVTVPGPHRIGSTYCMACDQVQECERCGERFTKDSQRAEVATYYDDGGPDSGPHLTQTSQVIHASCMREGEEIA